MKIEYTVRPHQEVKKTRHFFKKHVHDRFVKFVARKGLLDSLLSREDVARALSTGKLPRYLCVHHIRPISGTPEGANRFDNLVVMHDVTHSRLHQEVYQPQLAWVDRAYPKQTRSIEVPAYRYVDTQGITLEYKRELEEYIKQKQLGR